MHKYSCYRCGRFYHEEDMGSQDGLVLADDMRGDYECGDADACRAELHGLLLSADEGTERLTDNINYLEGRVGDLELQCKNYEHEVELFKKEQAFLENEILQFKKALVQKELALRVAQRMINPMQKVQAGAIPDADELSTMTQRELFKALRIYLDE